MTFYLQGWEQCVCLDMNDFYLGLIPEEERRRVENLEPFDEYEVSKHITGSRKMLIWVYTGCIFR